MKRSRRTSHSQTLNAVEKNWRNHMKRLLVLLLASTVLAAFGIGAVHSQGGGQNNSGGQAKFRRIPPDRRIANQYIVVLNNSVGDVETEAVRLSRDYSGDRGNGHTYHRALKGFSARMSEQQATRLAADPRVAFVEEDSVVSISTTQTGATWGIDRIDQ